MGSQYTNPLYLERDTRDLYVETKIKQYELNLKSISNIHFNTQFNLYFLIIVVILAEVTHQIYQTS